MTLLLLLPTSHVPLLCNSSHDLPLFLSCLHDCVWSTPPYPLENRPSPKSFSFPLSSNFSADNHCNPSCVIVIFVTTDCSSTLFRLKEFNYVDRESEVEDERLITKRCLGITHFDATKERPYISDAYSYLSWYVNCSFAHEQFLCLEFLVELTDSKWIIKETKASYKKRSLKESHPKWHRTRSHVM
ncbi:unnamed protein product [Lactuca virosa]|uniref:Uncharacterized protein n=1 Tax=Lactuca virosa TaxID=75947 RepID=A0AAU9PHA1_9ASTR|nr:unnamed protein product [Lactuca virosa]